MLPSVESFRHQAHIIFHLWSHQWLKNNDRNAADRGDSQIVVAMIQVLYWSELRRNPTAREWAHDFIEYYTLKMTPASFRVYLQGRSNDAVPVLDKTQPWKYMLEEEGLDALRVWSFLVGCAFFNEMEKTAKEIERGLVPYQDYLTDSRAISAAFHRVVYGKSWWRRLVEFVKKMFAM